LAFGTGHTWYRPSDELIHLVDVLADRPVRPPLKGHTNQGIGLAFNHTGDRLMSSDWAGLARLWDVEAGQQQLLIRDQKLTFGPDDRLVGSAATPGRPRLYRFEPGREFRAFRAPEAGVKYSYSAVYCGGRLLAVGSKSELAFIDTATGQRVARLTYGLMLPFAFEAGPEGALLAHGPTRGVTRWPVRPDGAGFRIGPPESLPLPHNSNIIMCGSSADGRVVSTSRAGEDGAVVWHRDRPDAPVTLGPQSGVRYSALSPDGRWAATHTHSGQPPFTTLIWDTATGHRVTTLPGGQAKFSPDNRWIYLADRPCRLATVGAWTEGRELPEQVTGLAVFSSDGRLLAAQSRDVGVIELIETASGRSLARLTAPEPAVVEPLTFSPDGRALVTCADSESLQIWDLPAIRAGLREFNLDWDAPPYPPVDDPRPGPAESLRVRIDRGDFWGGMPQPEIEDATAALRENPDDAEAYYLRGQAHWKLDQFEAAIADYRAGLRLRLPASGEICNHIAWIVSVGPPRWRDPAVTLPLARRAVELNPGDPGQQNTLGTALFRAGRIAEAVGPLETSLANAGGRTDAYDLYFLAMCHQQLHDPARATDCLYRALEWHARVKGLPEDWVAELNALRAETLVRLGCIPPHIR
jgi:WD40 repeat protein